MKIRESLTDQYLRGDMSAPEIKEFEHLYQGSPEKLKELQLIRTFGTWATDPDALAFSLKIQAERNRRSKTQLLKQTSVGVTSWNKWIAAAVILILLGGPGWYAYHYRHLSSEQIFEKYYSAVGIPGTFRSGSSDINPSLQKGLAFFNNGEFVKATKAFDKVVESYPDRLEYQLMLGVAALESKEYGRAIASLNKVLDHGTYQLAEEAEWALGFVYLMSGDNSEAIRIFKEINSKEGYYSRNAGKIIRRLKK